MNSNWDETLMLVLTDHGNAMPMGPNSDTIAFEPIENNGQGVLPGVKWHYGTHTNENTLLMFAKGAGSEMLYDYVVGEDFGLVEILGVQRRPLHRQHRCLQKRHAGRHGSSARGGPRLKPLEPRRPSQTPPPQGCNAKPQLGARRCSNAAARHHLNKGQPRGHDHQRALWALSCLEARRLHGPGKALPVATVRFARLGALLPNWPIGSRGPSAVRDCLACGRQDSHGHSGASANPHIGERRCLFVPRSLLRHLPRSRLPAKWPRSGMSIRRIRSTSIQRIRRAFGLISSQSSPHDRGLDLV
jgi:hypothetical protein